MSTFARAAILALIFAGLGFALTRYPHPAESRIQAPSPAVTVKNAGSTG